MEKPSEPASSPAMPKPQIIGGVDWGAPDSKSVSHVTIHPPDSDSIPAGPNLGKDSFVAPLLEKIHGRLITDPSEAYNKKMGLGQFANSEITELATPFMVKFHIIANAQDALTSTFTERVYFVRAPKSNMGQANVRAVWLWDKWERVNQGKDFEEYPKCAGRARATFLDESDWLQFWRDAQRWPCFPRNWNEAFAPPAFTYFTDVEFAKMNFPHDCFDFFRGVNPEENVEA